MSIRFVFPPFLSIILVFSPLKLRHEAKVCVTQMRRKDNVGPQGSSSRSPATKGKHMGPYHRDPWCVRRSFIFASVFRCNGVGVLCGGGACRASHVVDLRQEPMMWPYVSGLTTYSPVLSSLCAPHPACSLAPTPAVYGIQVRFPVRLHPCI